ncbi:hypothetical protein ZEAMMB73_Zm00001d015417, partial [Zea mays]
MADGRLCVVSKEIAPAKREGLPLSHLEILDAVVIPSPETSLTEVDVQKFIEKQ